VLPFPVRVNEQDLTYSYIESTKEYIFSDALHQHFEKMTANELTGCFELNEFKHVCREEIPIYTYVPGIDCEATSRKL
jgi:hypothetical protein